MTITVFTSNQPRHLALISRLACIADRVYAILECNTVRPGQVADFFRRTAVMQDYFARVMAAESDVFGDIRWPADNVRTMSLRMGDLNLLPLETFVDALRSDVSIVFGASYIKPPLVDALVERRAINIHMGVSPWYRGSSTNFWAMYDRRPEFVGATVHLLSRGLDSGDMLFHAFPSPRAADPFVYGMLAVKAAHEGLIDAIRRGTWKTLAPLPQDRSLELRCTRNADFTDEVAAEYLQRVASCAQLHDQLKRIDRSRFLRAFILD